ncbi:DNA recombination protein RmuC [Vibrio gallicus]|uniref:DNA recombination protein RmuC n=1 Tax=Vibrio gallicus TaxID=190897 RepID=UPI0021C3DF8D|nr:DNA recombination protein RmuC [Vibrio gallicus]
MNTIYIAFSFAIAFCSGLSYWIAYRKTVRCEIELRRMQSEADAFTVAEGKAEKLISDMREQISHLTMRSTQIETELTLCRSSDMELKQKIQSLESLLAQQQQQLLHTKGRESAAQASLMSKSEELSVELERVEQLNLELRNCNENLGHAQHTNGKLQTELATKQQHFEQQLTLLKESKQELSKEFERLASEILERKGQAFKQMNSESMQSILNPIHQELKGFKSKVEDIHSKETEQRVQLRTELVHLQKLNQEITDQASKLTTALKGEKKVQGNWGELMLENVLDNSGLRLGIDYKREVSINTEEGRLRPDAIVYLPQHKHLVIDAKTSLNAYTRYVNSEDQAEREYAIKQHASAVRDRINELASKEYSKLPGINSPEVVVMFIPVESAYVEALKYDSTLFQSALEKNILVATPTTLLTSLNIVRQLWRFEEQNKHTAELANRAEKFYSKLNTFLGSMEGVGKQLDKAKETYDRALGQLYAGKGNLIKQASEFKELGVAVNRELPQEMVEKAHLELDMVSNSEVVSIEHKSVELKQKGEVSWHHEE